MRPILAAILLALAWAGVAVAQLPAPGLILSPGLVLIADGCTRCAAGDRVSVTLHAYRPGVARAVVEVRAVVRTPDGFAVALPISGTTVRLPAGPSSITLLDVDASTVPPGVYLIEAAILEPVSGVTLSRDVLGLVRE